MTEVEVAKKVKKNKKVVEEVEVEVKKVKKSKKVAEEAADEEPAKKKKKKNKEAESEAATEVATEEEPKKEKKDKKKKKKTEEAEETDVPEESAESKADSDDEEPVAKKAKVEEVAKVEEAKEEEKESTTVFVGGLSFNSTEDVVKKDFAECGEIVNFRFPMDRERGTPKGIAFITYADQAGVKKALEFNETEYDGRTLRVRVADDSPPGQKGDKGKGKGKKGNVVDEKPDGCKGVIIKSMSYDTTEESLWAMFKDMEDSINKLNLVKDKETGASRGMAFVDFHTEEAVDEAMKKQGTELDGRSIFMNYNGPKPDKGFGKGKDGKGKGFGKKGDGKKGKGKGKKGKEPDAARTRNNGGIVASEGKTATFDSDSD